MVHAAFFIILLLMGLPIAFVLGVASLMFFCIEGGDLIIFPQRMFVGINKSVLMCIPFFYPGREYYECGRLNQKTY